VASPDDLVARAIAALRQVTVPADVAQSARATADEIERTWQRTPYVVSFDGDVKMRTELVNTWIGERVFDPLARKPGNTTVRLRHGERFVIRALHRVLHPPADGPRDDDARRLVAERERAELDTERALPMIVQKRPAVWAFWLWILRAILLVTNRKKLAMLSAQRASTVEARKRLAVAEDREKQEHAARELFYREVRAISSCEIEVELPTMPETVELVENAGDADARFDAAEPLPVAKLETAAKIARGNNLAARARYALEKARGGVEEELARADAVLQQRIAEVEAYAVTTDRTRYTNAQLDRIKPQILASTTAAMEHASTHLLSGLAELSEQWVGAVAAATNPDELKAAVAKIEDQWIRAPQQIAEEVRTLVAGGVGGVARDLVPEIVAPLRAHGLPEEHLGIAKRAPAVAAVAILPSLANPSTKKVGGSWLTGLFKSFETRRTEVREQVHARLEHLRSVAAAELLDAEPKLHAAVSRSLVAQLDTAMTAQQSWYQQTVADEHAAIARDREALEPQLASRDALARAEAEITRLVDALDAEQPAIAAAAVAAAS
jgi:hypothetical protein